MDFKEQIEEDLNIFFNPDEFGEEHVINNQKFNLIIDNEGLEQKSRVEYDGILQADLLYYVKATDMIKKPVSGEVQVIDGAIYTVINVKVNSGVYEVVLQAGRH